MKQVSQSQFPREENSLEVPGTQHSLYWRPENREQVAVPTKMPGYFIQFFWSIKDSAINVLENLSFVQCIKLPVRK